MPRPPMTESPDTRIFLMACDDRQCNISDRLNIVYTQSFGCHLKECTADSLGSKVTGLSNLSWKVTGPSVHSGRICLFGCGLVDESTLTFVYTHELAHIATKSVGHKKEFWDNFKFLLEEAKETGFHIPIDYKNKPQTYCGITITDNPYYDV